MNRLSKVLRPIMTIVGVVSLMGTAYAMGPNGRDRRPRMEMKKNHKQRVRPDFRRPNSGPQRMGHRQERREMRRDMRQGPPMDKPGMGMPPRKGIAENGPGFRKDRRMDRREYRKEFREEKRDFKQDRMGDRKDFRKDRREDRREERREFREGFAEGKQDFRREKRRDRRRFKRRRGKRSEGPEQEGEFSDREPTSNNGNGPPTDLELPDQANAELPEQAKVSN